MELVCEQGREITKKINECDVQWVKQNQQGGNKAGPAGRSLTERAWPETGSRERECLSPDPPEKGGSPADIWEKESQEQQVQRPWGGRVLVCSRTRKEALVAEAE